MAAVRLEALFLLAACGASSALAVEPVRLSAQPQKLRTFYKTGDARVPSAVLETSPPLPVGEVTAIATASDGAIWYGTEQGLVRIDSSGALRDRIQYFAGKRYLPSDDVQRVIGDAAAGVWVRTSEGVAHIELRAMTLAQKAELFERRIRERHDRHGLTSPSNLAVAGDLTSSRTRDDDNDGLWTGIYAAAECFRYAVTRSPEALANARKALEAMMFLEQVTGRPGFPARSYIERGEPMPVDGEWHWTADGKYYWKGDTSSDEIVGHMYAYSVAFDLLPDQDLKRRLAATTRRIMDHILGNGYYLIDVTGKPTRWGRWSPQYFLEEPGDSSLNSLELLSFLKTTAHLTGDARYETEYRKVALEMRYGERTARYQELMQELNYSDEELAMLPFYCLFRYEHDQAMLDRYYRPALDQWWKNAGREDNPLWTFIYLTGRPDARVPLEGAARNLYRTPIDTIDWTVKNSQRRDIVMSTSRDRFDKPEAVTLLPPDERPVMKWNANPFIGDGGSGGRGEDDGAAFLLPYWMGRYHHFLTGE